MDLEAIYAEYATQLYRHALALTGQREDAEDVLQSVFVKLTRAQHARRRGAAIDDMEAYLHTAVHRQALTTISRRRRAAGVEREARERMRFVTADDERFDGDAERVDRAIRRLPPEQREVLLLHVYEDMTFRRLGELLGVSKDTAASRYRYAIAKLREWLDETE